MGRQPWNRDIYWIQGFTVHYQLDFQYFQEDTDVQFGRNSGTNIVQVLYISYEYIFYYCLQINYLTITLIVEEAVQIQRDAIL